jgi:hypothetical protein
MTKRIALFGDVHGCIDELTTLYSQLCHHSLDEIVSLGDLVDRGPASGEVVAFCAERGVRLIQGNHESSILSHIATRAKNPTHTPKNPDKAKTLAQIKPEHYAYLQNAPILHVWDDMKVVAVHGGLYPRVSLWQQPPTVKYMQMIHPKKWGATEWWGEEDEPRLHAEGWRRWTDVYDGDYLCVYGHSVYYPTPHYANNTLGMDTGCVYGGHLSAVILPEREYVSVPARRVYFAGRKTFNHLSF